MTHLPFRFFISCKNIEKDKIHIPKEKLHHLKNVLRINPKEKIIALDGKGKEYTLFLEEIDKNNGLGKIISVRKQRRKNLKFTLAQSLPKADKMDFIIQKCTEIGISKIIPIITKRTVVKIPENRQKKKLSRWIKIAQESIEKTGGSFIPIIEKITSLDSLDLTSYDKIILPWEEEKKYYLRNLLEKPFSFENIMVIIGPEGGFSKTEVSKLKDKGAVSISLGKRILRTETAGMITLTILLYVSGELG